MFRGGSWAFLNKVCFDIKIPDSSCGYTENYLLLRREAVGYGRYVSPLSYMLNLDRNSGFLRNVVTYLPDCRKAHRKKNSFLLTLYGFVRLGQIRLGQVRLGQVRLGIITAFHVEFRSMQWVLPKRRYPYTRLHDVTTQETVKTSNLDSHLPLHNVKKKIYVICK